MNASDPVDHGPDVTSLLISEHERFRRDMKALLEEHDALVRRDAFEALARSLVQHEVGEEATIYPAIGQFDGGPELRAEALRQGRGLAAHLARTMRRLAWRPRGRKTRRLVGALSVVLEQHLLFEEGAVFPVVASLEDEHKRQIMGCWAQRVEAVAPTRPHPHGPQHLPGLLTVGPVLAVIDRIRDLGRKLVRSESPRRSERAEPTRRRTHPSRGKEGTTWR